MKAYKTSSSYKKVGETPKGRIKMGWSPDTEEIPLDGLVKFCEFDMSNLNNLENQLIELGRAVSAILLSNPDSFKDYFEHRVKIINNELGYQEKITLE